MKFRLPSEEGMVFWIKRNSIIDMKTLTFKSRFEERDITNATKIKLSGRQGFSVYA